MEALNQFLARELDPTLFDAPILYEIHSRDPFNMEQSDDGAMTLVYATSLARLWHWIHQTSNVFRMELNYAFAKAPRTNPAPHLCEDATWMKMRTVHAQNLPLETFLTMYYILKACNWGCTSNVWYEEAYVESTEDIE